MIGSSEGRTNRNAYKEVLRRLLERGLKITDPAVWDLLPHLSHNEAKDAIDNRSYIALPPLMFGDSVHIVGPSTNQNGSLHYFGCVEGSKCNDNILFTLRACEFSIRHWEGHFFKGEFEFVLSFILRRFGKPAENNMKTVWVFIDKPQCEFIGMINAPLSELIDESAAFITVNPFKAREAGTRYLTKAVYSCAYCGSPLRDQGCPNCRDRDIDCQPDLNMGPLPPKVINHLLGRNYKFTLDPFIALERERLRFEASCKAKI